MTQTTKKALAGSLKKLLFQKPLNKITVIDIVDDCGVNRQTFYYHFQDIYDLVEWIYYNETKKALDGKRTYSDWQEGFLHVLEYILENKAFVINTYNSISREHLERHLYSITYNLLAGVIDEKAAGIPIRDTDKKFVADFYKFAFVGLVLDWIQSGMKENPEDIIKRLQVLIRDHITTALERFRTDRQI